MFSGAQKKRGKIRLTVFPNNSFFRTVVITNLLTFHSADCYSDGRVLFQQELFLVIIMGEAKRSQVVGSLGVLFKGRYGLEDVDIKPVDGVECL